jgi:NAD(P)-dependent dehydrogenase (short-subunit alcohol dehydrogenase family)
MTPSMTPLLRGRVALVAGRGEGRRAVARALAARGVSVVVLGPDERTIAEIVGEIACGAGKARHIVGDPGDPSVVEVAAARARDDFGGLDATWGCVVPGVRAIDVSSGADERALGELAVLRLAEMIG